MCLPRFKCTGDIEQMPPMYSAIKIGGQKLYELARRGVEVERQPRQITIFELELMGGAGCDYTLRVRCSKGTYVRTLCHDLGQMLGCGACMSSLRRTKAGMFTLSQAITLPQILEFAKENDPQELLMPVDALFFAVPAAHCRARAGRKAAPRRANQGLALCARHLPGLQHHGRISASGQGGEHHSDHDQELF